MDKVKLTQGTLQWERARESRIGGSEVFGIVRYYATPEELQNCGLDSGKVLEEAPYTSVWALYHKMLGDGLYHKEALPPEYAEYGHVVEPYGARVLQEGRSKKIKAGEVYVSDKLIASLDLSGVSEEVDCVPFTVGSGMVPVGKRFVCEQKTMRPERRRKGLPAKYIVQAQYQAMLTGAEFFIIQLMILCEDTAFERGRVCGMNALERKRYLDENMDVQHLYFRYSEALARLISVCLDRFFADVEAHREPRPFLGTDSVQNILESIRSNTYFDPDRVVEFDLGPYAKAKSAQDAAGAERKKLMSEIVVAAMDANAVRFVSQDGTKASFSKDGKFLLRPGKEAANGPD